MEDRRIPPFVIRGEDGVAGFFEDLPVLMFVLIGASVLVMSGAWVARQNAIRQLEQELDDTADTVVRRVLGSILSKWGETPRVTSLLGLDLAAIVSEESRGHEYAFAIASLHPEPEVFVTANNGDPSRVVRTGFASALFNALDERGLVLILEVRAIVW